MIDLLEAAREAASGPAWGHECEDLDLTLLKWFADEGVAEHVNEEVDVVMVVLSGEGVVTIGGLPEHARSGSAFVIPKGVPRAIRATSKELIYLNVHKRRRRLMPLVDGRPPQR